MTLNTLPYRQRLRITAFVKKVLARWTNTFECFFARLSQPRKKKITSITPHFKKWTAFFLQIARKIVKTDIPVIKLVSSHL
jgi:hypothetical protein